MAKDDPFRAFEQARKLGPLALLRLRAEVLLRTGHPFRPDELEELERIAAAPHEEDGDYLGAFDFVFEADLDAPGQT
jgi:hypothetical protein